MNKKVVSVLLAASVAAATAFSFTGCSSDGRIKIKVGMWPDATLEKDVAMFKVWEENFERDYPEYDIVPDAYDYNTSTVTQKFNSHQLPTIFQTYFTEPQKLVEQGYIADITDELKELKVSEAADSLSWYDVMEEGMRDAVSQNGRVYGVPRDGYGMGLAINLRIFNDLGIVDKNAEGEYLLYKDEQGNFYQDNEEGREKGIPVYPTTFDDIREVSEMVVEAYSTGHYGIVFLSAERNGGWQFSNIAWNFGCEALQIDNGDGTWKANLNDPKAVEALQWMQDMRKDGLTPPGSSFGYNQWFQQLGTGNVAMAFTGSDALDRPITNYPDTFKKDDLAFVPMPSQPGVTASALYGGTPYVINSEATKEQIKGALLFLKYMGRSPETDAIAVAAIDKGFQTAKAKNMPILQTMKPWTNKEYLDIMTDYEKQFVNVNVDYFADFYEKIDQMKRKEEPNFCQDMYQLLDEAIQAVIKSGGSKTDCYNILTTKNSTFQSNYLNKIKQ